MRKILAECFVVSFVFLLSNFSWAAEQISSPRTIGVNAEAEVNVVPDEVILNFGVETQDKSLAVAKNQNDEVLKSVLKLVKEFKIEDKYVQTDYIGITSAYDHYSNRREETYLTGYIVRKTIAITLKDVSKFEEFLQRVLESGVNYVQGIQFHTTELRKYRDQASSLAIKAAQQKANDIAKEFGEKVGKPQYIQELSNSWGSNYGSWWGQAWNSETRNVVQSCDNAGQSSCDSEATVALRQIKVKANVSVTFELQ